MKPSISHFTSQCRHLQGLYRESIGEPMGVGPFTSSKNRHENMIVGGEVSGKNFLDEFTFQYAKARVAGKQKNETIEEYRLFNNLLSSQPMAFNLFCPFIHMLEQGREAEVTRIFQTIFPQIDICEVTEVGLEFLHTDIDNYLSDKTAMDAIIRYKDSSHRPCFIAIETKYTDVLGTNSAQSKALVKQKALIQELGQFKPEAERQLLDGTKAISQIYRNYLLAECYRIMESAHESYSVVLAPAGHPTTAEEVSSLREELKEEFRYKVIDITLEYFVEKALSCATGDLKRSLEAFWDRYLDFGKMR